MMFIERKAFVEYLDSDKIRITTPLRQKEFQLKDISEDQIVDLIALKIVKAEKSSSRFFALVDNEQPMLEIFANGRKIGDFSFGEKNRVYGDGKLFKSKILEND